MRRREFITALGGAAVWPIAARAQTSKVWRIGYVATNTAASTDAVEAPRRQAFLNAMRDLNYIEGQNIVIEWRFADFKLERLGSFAEELVRLKVDAVVVPTAGVAQIFRNATREIPIIVWAAGSFDGTGLIESLNRPGGNVTGVQLFSPELMTKRIELLTQIVPRLQRIGFIEPLTPAGARSPLFLEMITAATKKMRIELRHITISSVEEFKTAFADLATSEFQAALVLSNPLSYNHPVEIAAAASESRVPTMYESRYYVEAGGLISYGPSRAGFPRLVAGILDEVLRGTAPAVIPIRQVTRFDLAINLKTANALGLGIPAALLAFADQVIE